MHVAVTGATGVVGEFVVSALLAQGHQVVALSRTVPAHAVDRSEITWVTGDMADTDVQQRLLSHVDALIHCAFSHVDGRYRGGEGDSPVDFWRANFLTSLELFAQAEGAKLTRVIQLSSRAVFDAVEASSLAPDGRLDDAAGTAANTHYGSMKAALEAVARTLANDKGLSITTLRPTGVYGRRLQWASSKWYDYAQNAVRASANTHLSQTTSDSHLPKRLATEVHGEDVASAILLLLAAPHEDVAGRVFNCSDIAVSRRELVAGFDDVANNRELTERFAQLHPDNWPARSLRCDALVQLGWQPGGRQRLARTLEELVSAARHDV
ncbi:MAG: NAD(P)-dependent oxidoreductase [Pseudomonadaceae bacterium]|nr:NAD(P)-dependent oxidoreductase [Pseudomonadaceae bacterium]